MTGITSPAGWYMLEGELRYWDGQQWTPDVRSRLSPMERAGALDRELATAMQAGASSLDVRVSKVSEFDALVSTRQRVNHLLHFVIGLFTCGAWWLVWAVLAISAKSSTRRLHVDEWGRPSWSLVR